MRAAMLLALLLLAQSPAPAHADGAADAIHAYAACVTGAADRFERSAEPARDVATAALASCDATQGAVEEQLRRKFSDPPMAEETYDKINQRLLGVAIYRVVTIRMCRKTPGCPAPP